MATIKTYGDTEHTFVESAGYKGVFLPGFIPVTEEDPLSKITPCPKLQLIDHVVGSDPARSSPCSPQNPAGCMSCVPRRLWGGGDVRM